LLETYILYYIGRSTVFIDILTRVIDYYFLRVSNMEETRKVALSRFRRVMVSVLTIEPNVRGLRPLRGDGFL
jgi:hypothetical protein